MNPFSAGKGALGLGVIIIGPSAQLTDYLYREFVTRRDLDIYKVVSEYPTLHVLVRLLNSYEPDVVFLDMTYLDTALKVARDIQAASQTTAVIGFAEDVDPEKRFEITGSGVMEILQVPLAEGSLKRAIGRTLEARKVKSHENVVAFLPAKAGSGSTTTALNVAGTLVADCQKSVLIIEADLHSGLLPVLLNLDPKASIVNALEISDTLDDSNWAELLSKARGLDLLPTPFGKASARFTPWEYHRLLAFASPRYDFVIVDLPEVVNDATEAVVSRAASINIVCTPENSSLFLARRRIHELEARNVKPDRMQIVLNRHTEGDRLDEVEILLGRRVAFILPNDYAKVREATVRAGLVDPTTALARAYSSLSHKLAGMEPPPPPPSPDSEASGEAEAVGVTEEGGVWGTLMSKLRR